MSKPSAVIREEPIQPNSQLLAVDEAKQCLALAEFSLSGASRYTALWPRGAASFDAESVLLIDAWSEKHCQTLRCIVAWKHDEHGVMRIRHRSRTAALVRSGWQVQVENGLAIAVLEFEPRQLATAVSFARTQQLGWFLACGDWATATALGHAPFRATMEFFGTTQRLAPSQEFLGAMTARAGTVAYLDAGDDRLPGVIVVSSRELDLIPSEL